MASVYFFLPSWGEMANAAVCADLQHFRKSYMKNKNILRTCLGIFILLGPT